MVIEPLMTAKLSRIVRISAWVGLAFVVPWVVVVMVAALRTWHTADDILAAITVFIFGISSLCAAGYCRYLHAVGRRAREGWTPGFGLIVAMAAYVVISAAACVALWLSAGLSMIGPGWALGENMLGAAVLVMMLQSL